MKIQTVYTSLNGVVYKFGYINGNRWIKAGAGKWEKLND